MNTILKQDWLGRGKTPQTRREQLLDKFERSALPGLKFAELAGIKYQTFATWAQKRRDDASGKLPTAKKSVQWLEAVPIFRTPKSVNHLLLDAWMFCKPSRDEQTQSL